MSKRKRNRFQFITKKFPKRMQKKLVMLFIAIVLAFTGLVGKITHINATNGERYTRIVLDQLKYNSREIPFRRGDIVDRNGTVIATSERVYNVVLDSYVMLYQKEGEEIIDAVREVQSVLQQSFGIEPSVIDEIVSERPDSRYNVLIKKVSYSDAQEYKALIAETYKDENNKDQYKYPNSRSCIWLEEDYIRSYPYNYLASDLIGFTVAGNVGNGGLEAAYNSILNADNLGDLSEALEDLANELNVPVKFVGVGEQIDDLQPFKPLAFADGLFDRIDYKDEEDEHIPIAEEIVEEPVEEIIEEIVEETVEDEIIEEVAEPEVEEETQEEQPKKKEKRGFFGLFNRNS